MKYFAAVISFLLLIQSCTSPSSKVPTESAFKPSPLDSVYTKLRPQIQIFSIDNNKVNTVKAANGTEILVPANCFANGNGESIKSNIQIEIVEAFSLRDFITSGLATRSGDKVLLSNGMMYVNATSGGVNLQLNVGASLSVSMPTMNLAGGFQMFTGDGTNWTVDSSMQDPEYAITLPLSLLYPEGNKYIWHCLSSWKNGEDRYAYYDTTITSFTNPKYENTIIATGEFQRRAWLLREMTDKMSYFTNSDYYFDKTDCFGQKFNYDLWRAYYDNPNRSFAESDSVAKKMYIDYFNKNHDKIAAFCDAVNKHKREYFSNWTDTNYYFDYRKISLKDDYMELLKYFPPANTKEIKRINDHGVNVEAANAYDLLKEKGVDEKEINEILTYSFRRQYFIKMLQREKDAMADKEKLTTMYESTMFSVTKMGWINCDRFFDDPAAGKAEIYVTNTSNNDLQFMDCSLVIPDMNVRLSAFPGEAGSFAFTKKDGPYTKLPIGKSAIVIAIALQHDSLFFASKKINIKDGLIVGLPMKYMGTKNLNDSLNAVLN